MYLEALFVLLRTNINTIYYYFQTHLDFFRIYRWTKVNVGGVIFRTTMSTLLKGDTMLARMVSSEIPVVLDEEGAILIDRDPQHFRKILNFLRTGMCPAFETDRERIELKLEAYYYGIEALVKYCENYKVREEFGDNEIQVYIGTWEYDNNLKQTRLAVSFNCFKLPLMSDDTMSLTQLRKMWGSPTCLYVAYNIPGSGDRFCDPDCRMLKIKDDRILPPQNGWYNPSSSHKYFILLNNED